MSRNRIILLIGPPGAGKSTAVKWANRYQRERRLPEFHRIDLNVVVQDIGRLLCSEPTADVTRVREILGTTSCAGDAAFVEIGRACAQLHRLLLPPQRPLVVDVGTGFLVDDHFSLWMAEYPTVAVVGSPEDCCNRFNERQARNGSPEEPIGVDDYRRREFAPCFSEKWHQAAKIVNRSASGDEDLEKLMKQLGWRFCKAVERQAVLKYRTHMREPWNLRG